MTVTTHTAPLTTSPTDVTSYLAMERDYYADLVSRSDYAGSGFARVDTAELVVGSYAQHEVFDYERWLLAGADFGQDALALDYGCGPGRMLLRLAGRFARVDGTDICAEVLDIARRRCAVLQAPPHLYRTDGQSLPPQVTDTYDFAFSVICLQHICVHAVRHRIFASLFRALKPGGMLAFQMGYGPGHPGMVDYYEDFVDAPGTNGVADVGVLHPSELCADLASIGFSSMAFALTPTGPGDTHGAWIFVRALKPGRLAAVSTTIDQWTRHGFDVWTPNSDELARARMRQHEHGLLAHRRAALARMAELETEIGTLRARVETAAACETLARELEATRNRLTDELETARVGLDQWRERAEMDERQMARLRSVDLPRLRAHIAAVVQEANARRLHIAVFGSGAHTEWLADHTELASVRTLSVVDSDVRRCGRVVLGCRVEPASALPALAPDVVLVSSLAFQEEMATFVESLGMRGARIVRCYT